jgi:hypothetical protein
LIEYPLERLQDSVRRFVVPSIAVTDIQALRLQIELRRRALKDIEVISSRLRLWDSRTAVRAPERRKSGRPSLRCRLRRGGSFGRQLDSSSFHGA